MRVNYDRLIVVALLIILGAYSWLGYKVWMKTKPERPNYTINQTSMRLEPLLMFTDSMIRVERKKQDELRAELKERDKLISKLKKNYENKINRVPRWTSDSISDFFAKRP
jgi:hypothetical protein